MIACEEYVDPAVAPIVKGFLQYVASAEGQEAAAASRRQRARSRTSLAEQVNAAIDLIVVE